MEMESAGFATAPRRAIDGDQVARRIIARYGRGAADIGKGRGAQPTLGRAAEQIPTRDYPRLSDRPNRTSPFVRSTPCGTPHMARREPKLSYRSIRETRRFLPGTAKRPGPLAGTGPLGVRGARRSLVDLGDAAGTDGAATLTDREAETVLHGDRLDQLDRHVGVVARHDHLGALGEGHDAGHVRRTEVELRAVVVEERRVTAALLLREDVDRGLEVGVRGRGARLDDDHAALDVLALGATQEQTDVLARLALVEQLAEHLDAGDGRLLRLLADADDLDLLADLDDAALDATGDDGATTGDREDVLDRHQERLVGLTRRGRDVLVDRGHELEDRLAPLGVAVEGREGRHANDRDVVARELVLGEELAHLHLDELDELLVVDHVALVERHDQGRHADLAGEQHVLTRLRHRT